MNPLTGLDVSALTGGRAMDLAAQIDAANEHLRELQVRMRELADTEFTGSSTDGLVSATVTGAGQLRGVTVSAYAMRDLNNVELGAAACAAIGAARLAAAAAMRDAMGVPADRPGAAEPVATDLIAALRTAIGS